MSTEQPTEEELRAAYEAEVKKIRVEHVLLEHVVSLVNLGMRRTGLSPGTEDERDVEQVRVAIDAIRAMLPLLERTAPELASHFGWVLLGFAAVLLLFRPRLPAAHGLILLGLIVGLVGSFLKSKGDAVDWSKKWE